MVRLDKPASASVLPDAVLPLSVLVEDTQFAVRSAWLEVRVGAEGGARRTPLYDHADGLVAEAATLSERSAPSGMAQAPGVMT